MENSDVKILAAALTGMAKALESLADSQATLIAETAGIRGELRGQSKTIARSLADQKERAAEMMEAAREVSTHAPNPGR